MESGLAGLSDQPKTPRETQERKDNRITSQLSGHQGLDPPLAAQPTYPHLLICLELSTYMCQAFHMHFFKQWLRLETLVLNQPDPQSNHTTPLGKLRKVIEHLSASLCSSFK